MTCQVVTRIHRRLRHQIATRRTIALIELRISAADHAAPGTLPESIAVRFELAEHVARVNAAAIELVQMKLEAHGRLSVPQQLPGAQQDFVFVAFDVNLQEIRRDAEREHLVIHRGHLELFGRRRR